VQDTAEKCEHIDHSILEWCPDRVLPREFLRKGEEEKEDEDKARVQDILGLQRRPAPGAACAENLSQDTEPL